MQDFQSALPDCLWIQTRWYPGYGSRPQAPNTAEHDGMGSREHHVTAARSGRVPLENALYLDYKRLAKAVRNRRHDLRRFLVRECSALTSSKSLCGYHAIESSWP